MNRLVRALLLLMLMVPLEACDGSGSGAGHGASTATTGTRNEQSVGKLQSATLLDPKPFESRAHGALHGLIRVSGNVPPRFLIGARKKSECCKFDDVDHMSDTVIAEGGKLQYAYVSVISGLEERDIPMPPENPHLVDQRGCVYTPHVSAMRVGQMLHISNSDPTAHNVNMSAPNNHLSPNRGMVAGQDSLEFEFRRPDLVKLRCDLHPWMTAFIHVSEHPWFAITDGEGAFSIPNLPPGKYVIEVQHEEFGSLIGSVTIQARTSTGVTFTFASE